MRLVASSSKVGAGAEELFKTRSIQQNHHLISDYSSDLGICGEVWKAPNEQFHHIPFRRLNGLLNLLRFVHSFLNMFLTRSWFWRGFQSAIFYYLSCAPLSKLSYRRKRRKEYKRAKAEKAMNEMEGGLYQHPSPFSTNPYWEEEIAVGPGPPVRKAQRDGRGKPETGKQKKEKERQVPTSGVGSSTDTGISSAETVVGGEVMEQGRDSREGWNKKRYQREDEILWGLEQQSTSASDMARLSRSGSGSTYQYYARNPAINDLHPPVVSTQPRNRTETLWMLQPPPKAKVMEGKERASLENLSSRSRSTSAGSNWSRGTIKKTSDMSLGRQIGERVMESKLKHGNLPLTAESSTAMSRGPSARSNRSAISTAASGQPHDRDTETPTPTRSGSMKRKQPPPPPISISSDLSLSSPPPARPPLSTIPSETLPQRQRDRTPHVRPRLSTTDSVSSLQVLQELVIPSSQLNAVKAAPPSQLSREAVDIKLPPVSHQEDNDLNLPEVDGKPLEGKRNLPPPEKENHKAPSGHHRWSMSI